VICERAVAQLNESSGCGAVHRWLIGALETVCIVVADTVGALVGVRGCAHDTTEVSHGNHLL
jgi:hypothetical protein